MKAVLLFFLGLILMLPGLCSGFFIFGMIYERLFSRNPNTGFDGFVIGIAVVTLPLAYLGYIVLRGLRGPGKAP